jgi:hypothetical protein
MIRHAGRAVVALLLCGVAASARQATNTDAMQLADFKKRVDDYVSMRKTADNNTEPLKKTDDPAKIRMAQQQLAERIRTARTGAKRGDIFTPAVTVQFRRLLRPEVKEKGTKASIADDNPGKAAVPFKINGPYPEGVALATAPPNVLASLPALPEDIEYRFVGKHMVLRDSRANLIIDYITDAIP